MNILITGGAGFIGSHTYVALLAHGYTPIIVDNFSNSNESVISQLASITNLPVEIIRGDINNPAVLDQVFSQYSIEGVIHFAAAKAVGESVENPLKYYRNNVGATILLLEKMQEHGVNNLVFSSSCTVYGQPETLPVTENSPVLKALSPYGNTKQICEEIIEESTRASQQLKSISLRYFNPIGAHKSAKIGELPLGPPANLVPFLTQSVAGLRGPLQIWGTDYPTPDGTAIRDYIHVCDLASAHVLGLKYLLNGGESDVFNLGNGNGFSVQEVIDTVERATGRAIAVVNAPRRMGDPARLVADARRARTQLGWQPRYPELATIVEHAWHWEQQTCAARR